LGTRRSFICRIKLGSHPKLHNLPSTQTGVGGGGSGGYIDPNAWSTANSRLNRSRNTLTTSGVTDATNVDVSCGANKSNYAVVHVTGYTKIWPPQSQGGVGGGGGQQNMLDHQQGMYMDENNLQQQQHTNFHLIAIARIQMTSAPSDLVQSSNYEFVTRHDQNGLITFVDQRYS
jgi:hypothetical protein